MEQNVIKVSDIIKGSEKVQDEKALHILEENFRALVGDSLKGCAVSESLSDIFGTKFDSALSSTGSQDLTDAFLLDAFSLAVNVSVFCTAQAVRIATVIFKDEEASTASLEEIVNWYAREFGLVEPEVKVEETEVEDYYTGEDEWDFDDEIEEEEENEDDKEEDEKGGEDEKAKDSVEDEEISDEEFFSYYKPLISNGVDMVMKIYTSLLRSSFESKKFEGIFTKKGLISVKAERKSEPTRDNSVDVVYDILQRKLGFVECGVRSTIDVANVIRDHYSSDKALLYFPNKLLEFAYGCKLTVRAEVTYESDEASNSWSRYSVKLRKHILTVFAECLRTYLRGEGSAFSKNSCCVEATKAANSYAVYWQSCMTLGLFATDWRYVAGDLVFVRIRVVDEKNVLSDYFMREVIKEGFRGNLGVDGMESQALVDPITGVKNFSHEFNHSVNQALPAFAYKALLSQRENGIEPSMKNMVLGLFEDGSILKNGEHGVNMSKNLAHYIIAGSRAGKGVMTLNILASAINDGKVIFYLDRKPDMSALFYEICPDMFVLNGSDRKQMVDTVSGLNHWLNIDSSVNWDNVPDYLCDALDSRKTWFDGIGDIFYLRSLMLISGIILAYGARILYDKDTDTYSSPLGYNKGMILVVDEITNFASGIADVLSKMIINLPPSSLRKDLQDLINKNNRIKNQIRKQKEDREKRIRAAEKRGESLSYDDEDDIQVLSPMSAVEMLQELRTWGYSEGTFYCLDFLKAVQENIEFINRTGNAGFQDSGLPIIDIFCIMQDIGHTLMEVTNNVNLSNYTKRYADHESWKGNNSNGNGHMLIKGVNIASGFVGFKGVDAMFGRNEITRDYLAQYQTDSKAYGKLDNKASNFAYLDAYNDAKRALIHEGGSSKPRENKSMAESAVYFKPYLILNDDKEKVLSQMFKRLSESGISPEQVIADNQGSTPGTINPAVGFPGYLSLLGTGDVQGVLRQSSDVANMVVKLLGYPGNWFEFVTDLRPEWIFTIKDIFNALAEGFSTDSLDIQSDNYTILKEWREFHDVISPLSEKVSSGSDIAESYGSEDGFSEVKSQSDEFSKNLERAFERDVDIFGEQDKGSYATRVDSIKDIGNEDAVAFAEGFLRSLQQKGIDICFKDREGNEVSKDDIVSALKGQTSDTEEDTNYLPRTVGNPDDINYSGENISYNTRRSNIALDISNWDVRESRNSLRNLVKSVTNDVLRMFGGLKRITSFTVKGGGIILNNCCYMPKITEEQAKFLPCDLRYELGSGDITSLFDYKCLKHMPYLRCLAFYDSSIAYNKVRVSWGKKNITPATFFEEIKSLEHLKIGDREYSKSNYREKMANETDVFESDKISSKFSRLCDEYTTKAFKGSWSYTRNVWTKKELGVVGKMGLTAVGATGMTLSGGAFIGEKAAKVAFKAGKGVAKGVAGAFRSVSDALKSGE